MKARPVGPRMPTGISRPGGALAKGVIDVILPDGAFLRIPVFTKGGPPAADALSARWPDLRFPSSMYKELR